MSTKKIVDPVKAALDKAASLGIAVPDSVLSEAQAAAHLAVRSEQERIAQLNNQKGRFQRLVDGFISRYPSLQDSVVKLGNWIMALIKLVAVNGLVSVIMFAALIAETSRVVVGLTAIEANPLLAVLIAVVLVSLVFFLEFARYYLEREADWIEPEKSKWSLRLVFKAWAYRLGLGGESWATEQTTPAQNIIAAQRVIMFAVVVTALYGSMAHVIADHKGTWFEALVSIVKDSSLHEFSSWVIGLLITFAIALSAITTSNFVASRARLLEDSTFAVGEEKLGLIGQERHAQIINTYLTKVRRGELSLTTAVISPADLPSTEHAVPIRLSEPTDSQTDSTPVDLSEQTDRQTDYTKGTPSARAHAYFMAHPDEIKSKSPPSREIAKLIGTGKDTVIAVRKELADRQ